MCSPLACALVDAPAACGPYKTLTNRCRRWSEKGIVQFILSELARSAGREAEADIAPEAGVEPEEVLMIDATCVKAHRTACSLKKGRRASPDWTCVAVD